MKDYPKQHFAVVTGNLRCNACSKTLSLKKSSIDKHIKSSKHTNGVARIGLKTWPFRSQADEERSVQ